MERHDALLTRGQRMEIMMMMHDYHGVGQEKSKPPPPRLVYVVIRVIKSKEHETSVESLAVFDTKLAATRYCPIEPTDNVSYLVLPTEHYHS